jgi:toxin ParE1/3/4
MAIFTLTNKAKADLKSIAIYTQKKWGRQQRAIYLKQFDDSFHLLADTLISKNSSKVFKIYLNID